MINLFDMRHHYPKIIENDDMIQMNTNEWVDFNRVDIELLDGYMNKKG